MKSYKYREEEYVDIILEKGFQKKYVATELKLLAIRYRDTLVEENMTKDKVKEAIKASLHGFLEKHIESYSYFSWYRAVNKAVRAALSGHRKLITIKEVDITEGEADYIRSIGVTTDYQKIFFSFLVYAKLTSRVAEIRGVTIDQSVFSGKSAKYEMLKKMANVSRKIDINSNFIYDMAQKELIEILDDGGIRHTWLKYCTSSGKTVLQLKDFVNVGLAWEYLQNGKQVKVCSRCGDFFRVSRKNRKLCPECGKDHYQAVGEKSMRCMDCGCQIVVPAKCTNKKRCTECQKERRRLMDRIRKSKQLSASQLK